MFFCKKPCQTHIKEFLKRVLGILDMPPIICAILCLNKERDAHCKHSSNVLLNVHLFVKYTACV